MTESAHYLQAINLWESINGSDRRSIGKRQMVTLLLEYLRNLVSRLSLGNEVNSSRCDDLTALIDVLEGLYGLPLRERRLLSNKLFPVILSSLKNLYSEVELKRKVIGLIEESSDGRLISVLADLCTNKETVDADVCFTDLLNIILGPVSESEIQNDSNQDYIAQGLEGKYVVLSNNVVCNFNCESDALDFCDTAANPFYIGLVKKSVENNRISVDLMNYNSSTPIEPINPIHSQENGIFPNHEMHPEFLNNIANPFYHTN